MVPFGGVIGASLGIGGYNIFQIAQFSASLSPPQSHVRPTHRAGWKADRGATHHVRDAMLLQGDRNQPWGLPPRA